MVTSLAWFLFVVAMMALVLFAAGFHKLQVYVEKADYDKHKDD